MEAGNLGDRQSKTVNLERGPDICYNLPWIASDRALFIKSEKGNRDVVTANLTEGKYPAELGMLLARTLIRIGSIGDSCCCSVLSLHGQSIHTHSTANL